MYLCVPFKCWCEMDSEEFVCFILVEDRFGLILEVNVLISKKYSEGGRVTFCAVWVASEGTFIYTKSHTGP